MLWEGANSEFTLSVTALKYSKSEPLWEAQISVLGQVLSTGFDGMKTTCPIGQSIPLQHTHLSLYKGPTFKVLQGGYGEFKSQVGNLTAKFCVLGLTLYFSRYLRLALGW